MRSFVGSSWTSSRWLRAHAVAERYAVQLLRADRRDDVLWTWIGFRVCEALDRAARACKGSACSAAPSKRVRCHPGERAGEGIYRLGGLQGLSCRRVRALAE